MAFPEVASEVALMITTERLSMELDANDGLARLRILRNFLKIVAERWLSCRKLTQTSQGV